MPKAITLPELCCHVAEFKVATDTAEIGRICLSEEDWHLLGMPESVVVTDDSGMYLIPLVVNPELEPGCAIADGEKGS